MTDSIQVCRGCNILACDKHTTRVCCSDVFVFGRNARYTVRNVYIVLGCAYINTCTFMCVVLGVFAERFAFRVVVAHL